MIRFALIVASTLGFVRTAALGNLMTPLLRAFRVQQEENEPPTMGGLCLMVGVLAAVGVGWTAACVAQPELLGAESLFSVRLLTALLGALLFGGVGLLEDLARIRNREIGFIFQGFNLIPNLTVRENIEVGAYLSDRALDVDELLHTLGLFEHQRKLPNQLSGGQQQRTAIGRAIVKNPDILLCDEPTGALDYNTSKEILKLIETVNQKYGNTVIMVTHNDAIKDMADRVVKLRDGMIRKNYQNEHKIPAMDLEW